MNNYWLNQVADQLSLALENAQLFQETQSRAEELVVLNELGKELATKLDPKPIAEAVYRFTSRLMDTRFFFIALYDEKNTVKSFPVAIQNGFPSQSHPTKLQGPASQTISFNIRDQSLHLKMSMNTGPNSESILFLSERNISLRNPGWVSRC